MNFTNILKETLKSFLPDIQNTLLIYSESAADIINEAQNLHSQVSLMI